MTTYIHSGIKPSRLSLSVWGEAPSSSGSSLWDLIQLAVTGRNFVLWAAGILFAISLTLFILPHHHASLSDCLSINPALLAAKTASSTAPSQPVVCSPLPTDSSSPQSSSSTQPQPAGFADLDAPTMIREQIGLAMREGAQSGGKRYMINYGDHCCKKAQKDNCRSGLEHGVDSCTMFSREHLDLEFVERNKEILDSKRGAGYYAWKPYILLWTLSKIAFGDFILYSDSGMGFVADLTPLFGLANNEKSQDIVTFHSNHNETEYTKRDAFVLMNCESEECVGFQAMAGTIVLRKSMASLQFVGEYLTYCLDPRIITDQQNVMGKENFEGWKDHRHDQSVLSLLRKKWKLKAWPDPTQWGNEYREQTTWEKLYGQLVDHHRQVEWEN